MLGDARVKSIRRQRFRTSNQREARLRDNQVQEAGLAADRTVALQSLNFSSRLDFESHPAAMAAAYVLRHIIGAQFSLRRLMRPASPSPS